MQQQQRGKKDQDGSAMPKRWTYRGVGSDHEIVVRLRESTPSAGEEEDQDQSKSVQLSGKSSTSTVVAPPERLQCSLCKRTKFTKDFWWCRTCQKTLCSCNLLQGHTEHRTAPWRPEELVRSLVDTVEARCTARTVRAAEEEASIKEYMREIENYFLSKLRDRLAERNNDDRGLMKAVSASTGVTFSDRKRWPSATPPAPVTANGTLTNLSQFSSLLTDDSLARLVREISGRLQLTLKDGSKMLTVIKSPRMLSPVTSATESPTSSTPLINGKVLEGATEEEDEVGLVNITQHFYSFAAVLPNVEPLEFAQMLEQQREYSPRLRSRTHSVLQPRGITPTMERVSSRSHSPAPQGVNGPTTLTVYGAVDVDGDKKKPILVNDVSQRSSPIHSYTRSEFIRGDYHRKTIPTSTVSSPRTETTSTHVVQAVISSEPARATPPPSANTSTRTEPTPRRSLPKSESGSTSDSRRRFSLPNRHRPGKKEESSPPLADTSGDSNIDDAPRRQRQFSSPSAGINNKNNPVSVTAFHFGEEFLTRPIDIRPMDNDLLAVSDSCGGVYITDLRGKVLHQIYLDGNSASSLLYVPFFNDQPGRPALLVVSVLRKDDRCINFYDVNNMNLLNEIPCPTEPDIDLGRSRWLATDDRGAIFMISGDGKMSALWKFHSAAGKPWLLLKVAPNTRYQYLDVVHHLANSTSVTLLTCNGIHGSILMITVSHNAKILAEQDFTDSYGLNQYIRSPASAVVDFRGNMLILDYSNGKLWILKSPKGNRQGGDRRLKLLAELGAQQAMGISIIPTYWQSERFVDAEQWCYVACFNKQRVHAVKYTSD